MNAPFAALAPTVRLADLSCPVETARIEAFVAEHPEGSLFHRPRWLSAVERGTGQRAMGLVAERAGSMAGWLPLSEIHSPLFGRALVSSGFGVGGGVLAEGEAITLRLCEMAEELALRLSCASVEMRGGSAPFHWKVQSGSHCGFVRDLAVDDEAELLAIPRKQRAEVRRGLGNDLEVRIGSGEAHRAAFVHCYGQSVRNLGTPVFPRSLFDAMLDLFGDEADILTIFRQQQPVASVLSFYDRGAAMPYWGGGIFAARGLRANDVLYYELMRHARSRGCTRFDFGRSKTGSGACHFKKNWGFEPQPLSYASWHAPGAEPRDVDPTSPRHAARIAAWKRLPMPLANRLGPLIARGLG